MSASFGYDLEALRECLAGVGGDATEAPPRYRALHVLGRCRSTNADARSLVEAGAEDGTVVVADSQTEGRGRLDRSWHSPSGVGAYVSVILREPDLEARLTLFPLLTGLALADAIAGLGADVALKWPNDVLVELDAPDGGRPRGGKKVAGILCEYVPAARSDETTPPGSAAILGVGVNVGHLLGDFPPPLRDSATSLRLALGHHVTRESVLCRFLGALNRRLSTLRTPADFPWDDWRARSIVEGRDVRVEVHGGAYVARALRVAADGALVVRTDDGEERRVFAGDVKLLRSV